MHITQLPEALQPGLPPDALQSGAPQGEQSQQELLMHSPRPLPQPVPSGGTIVP